MSTLTDRKGCRRQIATAAEEKREADSIDLDPVEVIEGGELSGELVVAIDFGTTYSAASFAKAAELEANLAEAVHTFKNWPGQGLVGEKNYSKTQTSIWYMQNQVTGEFLLEGLGWQGYLAYRNHLEDLLRLPTLLLREEHVIPMMKSPSRINSATEMATRSSSLRIR